MNTINKLSSSLGNTANFSKEKKQKKKQDQTNTKQTHDDLCLTDEAKAKFKFKNNYAELNSCIGVLEKAQNRVTSLTHLLKNPEELRLTDIRYHDFKAQLFNLISDYGDIDNATPFNTNFQKYLYGPNSIDNLEKHLKRGHNIKLDELEKCYNDLVSYKVEIENQQKEIKQVLEKNFNQLDNDIDLVKKSITDQNNSSLSTQLFSLSSNFKKLIS